MDESPTKRKPGAGAVPASLVPGDAEEQQQRLQRQTAGSERKLALQEAVDALRSSVQAQTKARDALLSEAGLTVDQARELNDELIERLHRYNDIKDAGQLLFGKLAELKGTTIKDVYAEYGVSLDD
ncbi:swi5-like zinc finger protein [Coemansia nantahalensis]|uniref:Swi5-like zinc finger protein n=1 Tax=Coemansia nantahalensis TaxID=2789366 RepID=A0ACC1JL24_9FUNG|nr:swi5-like zinc finger protein [Coemansia nantahalensis]KAJ2761518.1 swi5-like zinc finger protein [Coemansia nantahalensis]